MKISFLRIRAVQPAFDGFFHKPRIRPYIHVRDILLTKHTQDFIKLVVFYDFSDDNEWACTKTTTPGCSEICNRKFCCREVSKKCLIGLNHVWIIVRQLLYSCTPKVSATKEENK